jgi:F0F1-type ATP synthase delta subunit
MPKKAYGRRYAQAIFELALEKKELERWQSDLQKICGAVADEEFLAALESPKIPFKKKSELLSQRLTGLNPLAMNLVYLLVARS